MSHRLDKQNYIIVKEAVSKEVCELLADYANFKANLKPIKRNDRLAGTHREYADPMMETLLLKLQSQIEAATGLELWPSLSFYYTYKNGSKLQPHKDRSSCEIVAGLCIGADPEFKKTHGTWPLIIKHNNQDLPLALDYGDLVIFKGSQTEHWREAFAGTWFVSAIFAYVEKNGQFNFQKYDQRKKLGAPHVGMFRWLLGCFKDNLKKRWG